MEFQILGNRAVHPRLHVYNGLFKIGKSFDTKIVMEKESKNSLFRS